MTRFRLVELPTLDGACLHLQCLSSLRIVAAPEILGYHIDTIFYLQILRVSSDTISSSGR